jgi:hypothetical protein
LKGIPVNRREWKIQVQVMAEHRTREHRPCRAWSTARTTISGYKNNMERQGDSNALQQHLYEAMHKPREHGTAMQVQSDFGQQFPERDCLLV